MKFNYIRSIIATTSVAAMIAVGSSSCKIDEQVDPNFPSVSAIEANATVDELNNLVSGMESGMRNRFDTYLDGVCVIGREYYRFSGSDPRFTSDLLGKASAVLDPNTFYTTNPWADRYRVVRDGWILRHAIDNTSAALTDEQKNGYRGYAKTIQALELLYNLNMQYDNGIRLVDDVEDPENLGPFTSDYQACVQGLIDLLDDGYSDLQNGGDAFVFTLSSGFTGFNTPSSFGQFNRALAARLKLYHNDWQGTLDDLNQSFFNFGGDLTTGAYMVYSTAGGDIVNDAFTPLGSSPGANARCVQKDVVPDAELGDNRVVTKMILRSDTAFNDGLSSTYDVWVYKSNEDPICIIRNEELILIYAEANNENGNSTEAVNAINVIRESAGLPDYSGAVTQDALRDEILNQRRYSLFAEGHRWIDMRRAGKLGELPIDRPDDDVWVKFPIPASEEGF